MKPVTRFLTAGLLMLAVGMSAPALLAAQEPAPPPQPGQEPAPQKPEPVQPGQLRPAEQPLAPPVNPAEDAAFREFTEVPPADSQKLIQVGEQFLKDYPESRYRAAVYAKLAQAYLDTNQQEKMVASGEKALELSPDHVDVLSLLAYAIPRRLSQDRLDSEQQLQRTERYAARAIELLEQLQQPPGLTPEQFEEARNVKLAMAHSGLGLAHFHRQRYADAISEFEKATQITKNPEPTDFYLLGFSYASANRFHEAADAFEKCSQVPWPWQDRCKAQMDAAKKRAANQLAPPKP